eukprot:467361-Prymnesium_polylepis.2
MLHDPGLIPPADTRTGSSSIATDAYVFWPPRLTGISAFMKLERAVPGLFDEWSSGIQNRRSPASYGGRHSLSAR